MRDKEKQEKFFRLFRTNELFKYVMPEIDEKYFTDLFKTLKKCTEKLTITILRRQYSSDTDEPEKLHLDFVNNTIYPLSDENGKEIVYTDLQRITWVFSDELKETFYDYYDLQPFTKVNDLIKQSNFSKYAKNCVITDKNNNLKREIITNEYTIHNDRKQLITSKTILIPNFTQLFLDYAIVSKFDFFTKKSLFALLDEMESDLKYLVKK